MLITGTFDSTGSPAIEIAVVGSAGTKNYSAIIDTGFTGFVAVPTVDMVPLGLQVQGAANVMLGDGNVITNMVAAAGVTLGGQTVTGIAVLDDGSPDVLVGMGFLREFKIALILTNSAVVLYDENETLDAVAEFMATAPVGQPNTSPSAVT